MSVHKLTTCFRVIAGHYNLDSKWQGVSSSSALGNIIFPWVHWSCTLNKFWWHAFSFHLTHPNKLYVVYWHLISIQFFFDLSTVKDYCCRQHMLLPKCLISMFLTLSWKFHLTAGIYNILCAQSLTLNTKNIIYTSCSLEEYYTVISMRVTLIVCMLYLKWVLFLNTGSHESYQEMYEAGIFL